MAFVMLPCDLPHWCALKKQLSLMSTVTDAKHFTEAMIKIHKLCNVSTGLDPDESDKSDPEMFSQLEIFLSNLSNEEKINFYEKILPIMIAKALNLKDAKPLNGFHFSLQQQGDEIAYKRSFLASLLAHSFFSTFPKRTLKTHPTLQDFNFTFFFKFLDQTWQQAKLKSIFHYFELFESVIDENEYVTYSRQVGPQVISGKQWLSVEDWAESRLPLCPIAVRNDGSLDEVESQCLRICFSSSKIGGSVLAEGTSQESVEFCTIPELICILASVEALEENEVFFVKDAYQISKISQIRQKAILEKFSKPVSVCLCCMDAENYATTPSSQLKEKNLLRDLNKALLAFRQGKSIDSKLATNSKAPTLKRLSPIGESFSSSPREDSNLSKDEPSFSFSSCATPDSSREGNYWLKPAISSSGNSDSCREEERTRFSGSSEECSPSRPVGFLAGNRKRYRNVEKVSVENDRLLSKCQSEEDGDEIFYSARSSLDNEKEILCKDASSEGFPKSNAVNRNPFDEEIFSFTKRLQEALLRGARAYSAKTDESNYAVDISVSGSAEEDRNVRCKRGTSTGFILQEESLDDGFYQESCRDKNESDKYSFTTDESDMDLYEELTRWINRNDSDLEGNDTVELPSDLTSSSLKRALSDSFAVLFEGLHGRRKSIMAARSFSLEITKQNSKLAAQLGLRRDSTVKSMVAYKNGLRPVATGNWGCGSCLGGDPQIKLTIQWLAASYAGLPNLIYYTCRHQKLVKLDTVRRILLDRGWTVGQVTTSLLHYAQMSSREPHSSTNLFDLLITSVRD